LASATISVASTAGEPFRGHDVSRKSLASLVIKLATTPGLEVRHSLGVSTP
jgi:hypothetical protein